MTPIQYRASPGATDVRRWAQLVVSTVFALWIWTSVSAQTPRQFYASPTGLPVNDGTIGQPLDLATALSALSPVRPGDTLWLRGGVYRRPAAPDARGDLAVYVSTLNGTAAAPIVVRQYPGERATLDGNLSPSAPVLVVNGSYAWFWGFEITNSDVNRSSTRGDGVDTYGHHNRLINLVIHDTGQGVGFWATSQADDSDVYGSVISHVGWEGSDRGHGHSIYVQNINGVKRMTDNILFEGFSFGIHAYTQNGRIDNLTMTGNTVFNHGVLSVTGGPKANILFAGDQVAQSPTVVGNFGYLPAGSVGRLVEVSGCNNGRFQSNYLAGGTPFNIYSCSNTVVTGNTFYGPVAGSTQTTYPGNVYGTTPSGVFVGIRPNTYEAGRANITVFNWARQPSVPVDIAAAALAVGTQYEVRDAQNFFGPPVAAGVYNGSPITIPMAGLTATPVVGNAPIQPGHTGPEFAAFVLLPLGPPAPPPPPPPSAPRIDAVSPPSGPADGGLGMTISGSGFAAGATVLVGGAAATSVVVPNSNTISLVVPAHAPGTVDVAVTSGGQQAVRAAAFRYDPESPRLGPAVVIGSQVQLYWQAGGGTPVRGYALIASSAPGGSEFGPFPMGLATTTSAIVAPERYYVRVLADTAWGVLSSNEIAVVVGAPGPPGTPMLSPASISGRTVTLSWSAASGSPTAYVVVARYSAAGSPIATLGLAGTTLTVTAPPGTYVVSVVAVNAQGPGAESNQVVVTVP